MFVPGPTSAMGVVFLEEKIGQTIGKDNADRRGGEDGRSEDPLTAIGYQQVESHMGGARVACIEQRICVGAFHALLYTHTHTHIYI